ncbi:hypothetical protein POSPLADRAFT_1146631 [Postia placenta MAD-698-R-SB12]|uniref:DNA mismatch repair proteins mutS family domain-containing protein n=1 Tax=Postia placenta MAD-698-R-SB12 TaxID=670580 RepID=A0A1X6MWW0_9APHY|nr:hypothetical protein POSPLADRAFT_1146631 [Postia placenta MAD-698-R-SB12]OSX60854.1 hypothetical protein POSPLADRAFT_1146631 [Postia placenta MAD-698-R-SB12]
MAPANNQSKAQCADKLKQKSLMSFFGKPSTSTPEKCESNSSKKAGKLTSPSASKDVLHDTSSDSPLLEVATPLSKSSTRSSGVDATYTRSSDGGWSGKDTPPTSDPIDIDMLSDEDDGASVKSTAKPPALRQKRKIVLDESDEEGGQIDAVAYREGLSVRKRSPGRTAKGPQKKPRRLTKYEKPSTKSKARKVALNDDDFIVPDDVDEDEDESSHRSRSRASSLSEAESDVPERPKATKKTAKHPYLTKDQASGGSNTFLTAAERRVQDKKAEKKSSEDPFYFLQDVRDKDGVRPGQPGYDPRTLYIPPQAWKEFTPFEKQKGKFLELYEEDARIGHSEFDLKLTQRVKMSMVGVPEMAFNFWAAKFLAKDADELVPEDGKDKVYDDIMDEIRGLEEELDDELKAMERKLGRAIAEPVASVNLSYWHSAQGTKEIYLVQTKPSQKNVPKDWTKNGSTKAAVRWVVPSLQPTIRQLKEARENRNTAIREFKNRLYAEFDTDRAVWLHAIRVLSEMDCLFSLAKASSALGEPACRPELIEGDAAWVDFEELRHPALCATTGLKGDFIPNNVKLGGDVGRIALLTGLFNLLCPVDAILTRMGAYDNMFSNAIVCDLRRHVELGRGTSTYDGMAIAGAVLHQLATHTLALSFFATHYGSLTDDFAYHPNIRNMHMETMVDDEKRELVFLYKLIGGAASSSFGTHVASLAGVPSDVVERADIISNDFARNFKEKTAKKKDKVSGRLPLVAQADFAYLYGLAMGKDELPENKARRKAILSTIKGANRATANQLRSRWDEVFLAVDTSATADNGLGSTLGLRTPSKIIPVRR